jgi:hypothetical protein
MFIKGGGRMPAQILFEGILTLLKGIFTYTVYVIARLFGKTRGGTGIRSVIKAQTDQVLLIAPYAKSGRYIGALPQVAFDKPKGLADLEWNLGTKETIPFREISAIAVGKEGIELNWKKEYIDNGRMHMPLPGHIFYTIYLRTNDDRKFLIAKERVKNAAESLAETISRFLDVRLIHFERIDKAEW